MANLIPGVTQGSSGTGGNMNAAVIKPGAQPLNNNISGNGVPLPAIKQPLPGQVTGGPTPVTGQPAATNPAYTVPKVAYERQGAADSWHRTAGFQQPANYHPLVAQALQSGQNLHPALLHPTVNDAMHANQPLHPAIVQAIQTGQQLHPDIVHTLQQSINGPVAQPLNGSPGYGSQGRGFEGGQATGQPVNRPLYYGPGYGNQGGGVFQSGPQPVNSGGNVFQGGPQPVGNGGYGFRGL